MSNQHLWPYMYFALRAMFGGACTVIIVVSMSVSLLQGLADAERQRISEWRLTEPCEVVIKTWHLTLQEQQTGVPAAVQQLSGLLPAGSRVLLRGGDDDLPRVAAFIAPAAALHPHLTIYTRGFGQ